MLPDKFLGFRLICLDCLPTLLPGAPAQVIAMADIIEAQRAVPLVALTFPARRTIYAVWAVRAAAALLKGFDPIRALVAKYAPHNPYADLITNMVEIKREDLK